MQNFQACFQALSSFALSKYSPVTLHCSPATAILNETPAWLPSGMVVSNLPVYCRIAIFITGLNHVKVQIHIAGSLRKWQTGDILLTSYMTFCEKIMFIRKYSDSFKLH